MVRLRKNLKQELARAFTPASVPLQVPSSSMGGYLFTNPPQNLWHPSPLVFIPLPAYPHSLCISQPVPFPFSSYPSSEPYSMNLSSSPPLVFTPYSAHSSFISNLQPQNILSSSNLDLITSVYPSEQPFQNLSLVPPPEPTSQLAHPQFLNAPQPPTIFASNLDFHPPTSEDDNDIEMEWELPLGEPMCIDGVEIVMQDIDNDITHIMELAVQRNHFGLCTSLPYPLITQSCAVAPCGPQPVRYPKPCHPLTRLPTVYDEIDTPNFSPEWSAIASIDTAHVDSIYSSTPSCPLQNERQTTLGWSANDVTLGHPAHMLGHTFPVYEAEEQAALEWFGKEIAVRSRPHSCSSYSRAHESSINRATFVHHTHTFAPPYLPSRLRQEEINASKDAVKWVPYRQNFQTQSYLGQIPIGIATSSVKNIVKQPRPIRLPDSFRPRSNPVPPEVPDSNSWTFGSWKRERGVDQVEPADIDDSQMKKSRGAVQVVPASLFKFSASVLEESAAVLVGITSAVVKTSLAATKGLISTIGKIVNLKSLTKLSPEVIVINDDDDEEIEVMQQLLI
ncbi:hypothetical protein H2248_004575 [Termitomyces sp. 'cryptogamus']|nr:hypothetical protein H2248_004575 [Termitomyces sp. 'cryptogamus']